MTPTIRGLLATLLAFVAVAAAADPGTINTNYKAPNAASVGIVRVFDDGSQTVLILADPKGNQPTVTLPDGTPLTYRVTDKYAVLPGIQHHLIAYARGQAAVITYGAEAPITSSTWSPSPAQIAAAAAASAKPATPPSTAIPQSQANTVAPVPGSRTAAVITVTTGAPAKSTVTGNDQAKSLVTSNAAAHSVTGNAVAETKPVEKPVEQMWTIHKGEQLSDVLKRWSAKAGWQEPQWPKGVNYTIKADGGENGEFGSDFVIAVTKLIYAYKNADVPLHAKILPMQRLVVVTKQAQESN